MSAILSADDVNDFIAPGIACIKPIEILPPPSTEYEVNLEKDTVDGAQAKIYLTDCLACSGCISSSELMLVSHQSHKEVSKALESQSISRDDLLGRSGQDLTRQTTLKSIYGSS